MIKRNLLVMGLAVLLSACGFQLRGTAALPFDTLYIDAPQSSIFAIQVRRVSFLPGPA